MGNACEVGAGVRVRGSGFARRLVGGGGREDSGDAARLVPHEPVCVGCAGGCARGVQPPDQRGEARHEQRVRFLLLHQHLRERAEAHDATARAAVALLQQRVRTVEQPRQVVAREAADRRRRRARRIGAELPTRVHPAEEQRRQRRRDGRRQRHARLQVAEHRRGGT